MSAHTKLEPRYTDRVIEGLKLGMSVNFACDLAGVSSRAYHNWMALADRFDDGERNLPKSAAAASAFALRARQARAEGLEGYLRTVREGGRGWQAAAWACERQYPGYAIPRAPVPGKEVEVTVASAISVALDRAEALMAERDASTPALTIADALAG